MVTTVLAPILLRATMGQGPQIPAPTHSTRSAME
jgi:hypothetical protein